MKTTTTKTMREQYKTRQDARAALDRLEFLKNEGRYDVESFAGDADIFEIEFNYTKREALVTFKKTENGYEWVSTKFNAEPFEE